MKMIGVLAITVIIPLGVVLAIWADLLPKVTQVWIAQFGVVASTIYIVGGMLYLMYGDIKTKRYSKS